MDHELHAMPLRVSSFTAHLWKASLLGARMVTEMPGRSMRSSTLVRFRAWLKIE